MRFLRILTLSASFGALLALMASCEDELETIGEGVVGGEPFTTGKVEYEVFAFNKGIGAVQTNKLPVYQLGILDDPVYGRRKASIISQVQLPAANPTFGDLTQAKEDNATNDTEGSTIEENETVKQVFLYIPYLLPPSGDTDGDGVDDEFEEGEAVTDPNSDWDGDGVTDNQERAIGSDPFDPNSDGTGDGFVANNFPKRYDLDSIFGDRTKTFRLQVHRSNYYLRDLDPNSNFQEAQEYYSNHDFSGFIGEQLADEEVVIDNEDLLFYYKEDDPDTEDVDETQKVETRLSPGIRIPLDNQFFQTNILDREGQAELLTASNFRNFIRGLHLSGTDMDELMFLLDISRATITIDYEYQKWDSEENMVVTAEKSYALALLSSTQNGIVGNAVNVFQDDPLPPDIAAGLDNGENASRIYVKGGAAMAEIRLFDSLENGGASIIEQIRANNWIINEANLVFYVDRETLDNSGIAPIEPPRLYLYNARTNAPLYRSANESLNPGTVANPLKYFSNHDGVLVKEGGKGLKYTIRITEHLNDIIVRDADNDPLALSLTANISVANTKKALDLGGDELDYPTMSTINPLGTVLYGSNVGAGAADKKLKLEIFYTQAN